MLYFPPAERLYEKDLPHIYAAILVPAEKSQQFQPPKHLLLQVLQYQFAFLSRSCVLLQNQLRSRVYFLPRLLYLRYQEQCIISCNMHFVQASRIWLIRVRQNLAKENLMVSYDCFVLQKYLIGDKVERSHPAFTHATMSDSYDLCETI